MEIEINLLEILRDASPYCITGREIDRLGDPNMFCIRLSRSDLTILKGLLAESILNSIYLEREVARRHPRLENEWTLTG